MYDEKFLNIDKKHKKIDKKHIKQNKVRNIRIKNYMNISKSLSQIDQMSFLNLHCDVKNST
jgi:hypothetical protein